MNDSIGFCEIVAELAKSILRIRKSMAREQSGVNLA
jgi:hypothetical protein